MLLKGANEREIGDIFLFPKMKCKGLVLISSLDIPFYQEEEQRYSPLKILKPALDLQPLMQFSSRMHQWTLLSQ